MNRKQFTISRMLFFLNDTATTEIYTLSLHDALPICRRGSRRWRRSPARSGTAADCSPAAVRRGGHRGRSTPRSGEIGRGVWRGRGENLVVAVLLKKKKISKAAT